MEKSTHVAYSSQISSTPCFNCGQNLLIGRGQILHVGLNACESPAPLPAEDQFAKLMPEQAAHEVWFWPTYSVNDNFVIVGSFLGSRRRAMLPQVDADGIAFGKIETDTLLEEPIGDIGPNFPEVYDGDLLDSDEARYFIDLWDDLGSVCILTPRNLIHELGAIKIGDLQDL